MGFLEDWAVRSIKAFEAAGLSVAVDVSDGLESRASAWDEGYAAAQDDDYNSNEAPQFPQVTKNPYQTRKVQ